MISAIYECETTNSQMNSALSHIDQANVVIYYESPTLIEKKWIESLEKKGAKFKKIH